MTTPTMTVTTTAPSPATTGAPATAPAPAPEAAPAPAPAPEAAPAPAPVPASLDDAPAPAKPVGEVTPPVEGAPAPQAGEAISYEPTGNPGMDLALDFLGKLGFGPEDPAMAAAGNGDFGLLKAKLAVMGEKAQGWEAVLAVGEQGLKAMNDARAAEAQKTQDAILSVFGEDRDAAAKQWETVRAWAKENAEPEERAAVNSALAAGGIAAKAMAAYLNGLYSKHPSAVIEPATVTKMGGSGESSTGALSPAQYRAEISALRAKLGQGMDGSPEYKALQARRLAYRG